MLQGAEAELQRVKRDLAASQQNVNSKSQRFQSLNTDVLTAHKAAEAADGRANALEVELMRSNAALEQETRLRKLSEAAATQLRSKLELHMKPGQSVDLVRGTRDEDHAHLNLMARPGVWTSH